MNTFVPPIKSLYDHLSHLAKTKPNKEALLDCDIEGNIIETITYKDLCNKVTNIASWLGDRTHREDVVALAFPNSIEQLIFSWAAWATGLKTAPLDVKRDSVEEHNYKTELTNSKILIASRSLFKPQEKKKLTADLVEIENINLNGKTTPEWEKSLSHQCLILFTSGTTANPKGAQLSLQNLIANADGIKEWFNIHQDDRFLVQLPLHHINSTTFCLATLLAGATNILVPGYSKSRFWKQAAKTEATFSSIVQTICFDQLSEQENFEKNKKNIKLSKIQIGSAPVVPKDAEKFVLDYNIPLYQGYGQTETALRVTGVPQNLDKKTYHQMLKDNCIGTPMKWADVQIMGKDGSLLSKEDEGELAVKGPVVMKGYIKNNTGFKNDYFQTGDVGYFVEKNNKRFFYLVGRDKEIIIKGGINISPVAVENNLKQLNNNIEQVYAVPADDKRYGEEVAAAIIWKKGLDIKKAMFELKQELLDSQNYETPQYLTAIDESLLPLTSTGKVQRTILKENLNKKNLENISSITSSTKADFARLTTSTPYKKASFSLYNHCWQPLSIDENTWKKHLTNGIVIAATKNNKLRGMISLIRTSKTEKELLKTTYSQFTDNETLSTHEQNGQNIVCISICSPRHVPTPIKDSTKTPDKNVVKKYLKDGHDPVFNFHTKPKGGLDRGAELVDVIPEGRKEDKRSCGYLMLLKYPTISNKPSLQSSSTAAQLIEAVMVYANNLGIKNIYALSRPAGLSNFFNK